jgi:hypothetical protein
MNLRSAGLIKRKFQTSTLPTFVLNCIFENERGEPFCPPRFVGYESGVKERYSMLGSTASGLVPFYEATGVAICAKFGVVVVLVACLAIRRGGDVQRTGAGSEPAGVCGSRGRMAFFATDSAEIV